MVLRQARLDRLNHIKEEITTLNLYSSTEERELVKEEILNHLIVLNQNRRV